MIDKEASPRVAALLEPSSVNDPLHRRTGRNVVPARHD